MQSKTCGEGFLLRAKQIFLPEQKFDTDKIISKELQNETFRKKFFVIFHLSIDKKKQAKILHNHSLVM